MKLSYYNEEVNKILWDLLAGGSFSEDELPEIVDHVSDTIYQYDQSMKLDNLKSVVECVILCKYQKLYVCNQLSDFDSNVSKKSKTDSESKSNSESKSISKKKSLNPKPKSKIKLVNPDDSETMSIDADDLDDIEIISSSSTKPQYTNSETADTIEKVNLNSYTDLVTHKYDYLKPKYKDQIYIRRRKQVAALKLIPQYEQKTTEWLNQRHECLTATAIATALDEDPYKHPIEILLDKCGRGEPFVENENVHHGKKYEEIGNMFYSFRNNIDVDEYGLIQHDIYPFIGASPDGICNKNTYDGKNLSKLVGRLLEIKFPKKRKIETEGELDGDICPHYYYAQVQTQLFVTGLDECDFLQCEMEEYDSYTDFLHDTHPKIPGLSKKTNLERGCIIQLLPKKMINGPEGPLMCLYNAKYLYPPKLHQTKEEIEQWIATETINFHKHDLAKDFMIDRIIYWRFKKIACHLIKAEPDWMKSKIPHLKQFWNYILFYRKNTNKLDKLVEFVKKTGIRNTADIFARVNADYLSVKTDSKYEPLFQEENKWRAKYNKKYEGYYKFIEAKQKKGQNVNKSNS
jgi:putative phage-type endonuclease